MKKMTWHDKKMCVMIKYNVYERAVKRHIWEKVTWLDIGTGDNYDDLL